MPDRFDLLPFTVEHPPFLPSVGMNYQQPPPTYRWKDGTVFEPTDEQRAAYQALVDEAMAEQQSEWQRESRRRDSIAAFRAGPAFVMEGHAFLEDYDCDDCGGNQEIEFNDGKRLVTAFAEQIGTFNGVLGRIRVTIEAIPDA
jgi:hypothetical protein